MSSSGDMCAEWAHTYPREIAQTHIVCTEVDRVCMRSDLVGKRGLSCRTWLIS